MKKAQVGIIGVIFLVVVFVIVWFLWLGGVVSDFGQLAIETGGLTGAEAFFFANLNLWIFIALILGLMAFVMLGGR
jgi:hypothetical protein